MRDLADKSRGLSNNRACLKDTRLSGEIEIEKDKGVYVGVGDQSNQETDDEGDGLENVWMEMSMALEASKVFTRIHCKSSWAFLLLPII